MKLALTLLYLVSALRGITYAQGSRPLLDQEDVWLLVMNIPEVMDVECRKGCPDIEFTPVGKDRIWAMVRNQCPQSGNGTMGLYTVGLRDGRIWSGVDPISFIDSERLQRLRKGVAFAAFVACAVQFSKVIMAKIVVFFADSALAPSALGLTKGTHLSVPTGVRPPGTFSCYPRQGFAR